jgi:hypothetical protein
MHPVLRKFAIAAATAMAIVGTTIALPVMADARVRGGGGDWEGRGYWSGQGRQAGGYWRAGPWWAGNWGWGGSGLGTGLLLTTPYYSGYCSPYYYGPFCGYSPGYYDGSPYRYRRYYRYGAY